MKDFKRLLRYLKPHSGTFVFATIAMFLVALFESATGALLVPIFNQALGDSASTSKTLFGLEQWIPQDDWSRAWATIAGLLLIFTVFKGIAEYFSSYLMAKIGQSAVLDLREELYSHLLAQGTRFFERHRTNFLVSRLVNSCAAIELSVSANLRDVLRESFNLVAFVGAAFYFNWRLMLGALIIAPLIGFLTSRFSASLRRLAEEAFDGNKMLTDTAQETLANQNLVKAYRAEMHEMSRFRKVALKIARANLRSGRIAATSPPTIEIIGIVSVIILFYFGLREINAERMDAAQFFTFLFFLFKSYDPMRKISRQHNEISKAFAAAKDVWDVLDENDRLPEAIDAVELGPLTNSIHLKNVEFSYGGASSGVLEQIDITIPKGQVIALVGESGGGKSTLVKIIQRVYDPDSGSVQWDGIDLRKASVASLRKNMALVTQDTILFNETIRYNIAYGRPDATDEEVKGAATIAFADTFIDALPNGYETVVGERGALLSGGQRQRIAIARAVLMDAPLLILDEATSALDAESERLVQRALGNLLENKTAVVIAHRLSTIRKADRIVVMEKGRVVESGTHAELLAEGGAYKRLHDLQFFEEESPTT
jgi:subfamily B ATP-binding cassette protein MsbA